MEGGSTGVKVVNNVHIYMKKSNAPTKWSAFQLGGTSGITNRPVPGFNKYILWDQQNYSIWLKYTMICGQHILLCTPRLNKNKLYDLRAAGMYSGAKKTIGFNYALWAASMYVVWTLRPTKLLTTVGQEHFADMIFSHISIKPRKYHVREYDFNYLSAKKV